MKKRHQSLTKNQRHVLDEMKKHGAWARGNAAWLVFNAHTTQTACEALVSRGLVIKEGSGDAARYTPVIDLAECAAAAPG